MDKWDNFNISDEKTWPPTYEDKSADSPYKHSEKIELIWKFGDGSEMETLGMFYNAPHQIGFFVAGVGTFCKAEGVKSWRVMQSPNVSGEKNDG